MKRHGLLLTATLCCIGLGACRGDETTPAAAPKTAVTPPATEPAPAAGDYSIRHRIHPSLPDFTFTLAGDTPGAPSETLRVKRIEIRRATASEPFQVIDGLETETPVSKDVPGLAILDMNFDGYEDMRVVQFRSAGPNTPYLNWLFDPASGKFVENRELNDIPSAQFDPGTREIRSAWRDGATRYGTDIYVYVEGRPVLIRKEARTYQAPGVYVLTVTQRVEGAWKTVEQREVRESGAAAERVPAK